MHVSRRRTLRLFAAGTAAGMMPAGFIGPASAARTLRLAMVVRELGVGFSDAVHEGGNEAAKELGNVELVYAGPVKATAEEQIHAVEPLIAQHVDALMIAAIDPNALLPVCRKAMQRGIKVVSFDTGVSREGRILQLDPSSPALVGSTCVRMMAKTLNARGQVAILSTSPQAASQNAWIEAMKREWVKPEYAAMKLVATVYGDDLADRSGQAAQGLFKAYPDLNGIIAPTTVGLAAAAKAVIDAGLVGKVHVTGLGLPSTMKDAVLAGATDSFALWNPVDLGYAITTIAAGIAMGYATGAPDTMIGAGRMGVIRIGADGTAAMADPFVFDKTNVESFAKMF
jgi:rhamnose transport system substrate-binding protein